VDGRRGQRGAHHKIRADGIDWIDAAGYSVARSPYSAALLTGRPDRHDFRVTAWPAVEVTRIY